MSVDILGTGAQDVHLDFHTAPEQQQQKHGGKKKERKKEAI